MREERLMYAFGQIDEKFIEEANPEKKCVIKKTEQRNVWIKWGTIAACFVLVVGGAFALAMNGRMFKAVDQLGCYPENGSENLRPEISVTTGDKEPTSEGKESIKYGYCDKDLTDMTIGAAPGESDGTMTEEVDTKGEDTITDEREFNEWGLALSAKDVTPTGMTLVITQVGGEPTGTLQYGSDYHLKVLKNGKWVAVPYAIEGDVAWTAEAYPVMMGESVELKINWERLYGSLEAGTYRISKGFMDFREARDYDSRSFHVEFEIK